MTDSPTTVRADPDVLRVLALQRALTDRRQRGLPELPLSPDERESCRRVLAHAEGAAALRWPGVKVPDEAWTAYLADRLADEPLPEALARVALVDLYLACACLRADARALELFHQDVLPEAGRLVRRVLASHDADAAADVTQALASHLLVGSPEREPYLARYLGTGPLAGWVSTAALRFALMQRRRHRSPPARLLADEPMLGAASLSPELDVLRAQFKEHFQDCFQRSLVGLSVRDRTVLRFYLVDGLSAEEIGRAYRVHRATVARWIAQSRDVLRARTRALLKQRLSLESGSLERLFAQVESQLDLSVQALLSEVPASGA